MLKNMLGFTKHVEPYAWPKATLEAIAAGHPNDRLDDLLPWNFNRLSS